MSPTPTLLPQHTSAQIPWAPRAIQKGVPLKNLLGEEAIAYLARNISLVYSEFDTKGFCAMAHKDLQELSLMQRSLHIAQALRQYLPQNYDQAVQVLLQSLTEVKIQAEEFGLAEMFYLPHCQFVAAYGLDAGNNAGLDPFERSMQAQYQLTLRFTAEFSMRTFLASQTQRTLKVLMAWLKDANPHVRRLCCEATRPRLPWAKRLPVFIAQPKLLVPILEALKDDDSLYVRRSVANNLGDICKDHPQLVFDLCQAWLPGASEERKWVIRHALRHPSKKGDARALELRLAAKLS